MSIVTITVQKRIMIGAKTTQFTLIFVGNESHRAPALRKQQVCVG